MITIKISSEVLLLVVAIKEISVIIAAAIVSTIEIKTIIAIAILIDIVDDVATLFLLFGVGVGVGC